MVYGLLGCATAPSNTLSELQNERARQTRVDGLNVQLAMQVNLARGDSTESESYRLGTDDLLQINVFNVPELATEARVAGDGSITVPLIGKTQVAGLTLSEMEQLIASRLETTYVKSPQVTVLVKEYRSRQITVVGAVKEPKVYTLQRSLTLVDALAMAGGLDKEAGNLAYVTDQVKDSQTHQRVRRSLVVNLDELMKGDPESNVILGDTAVVNVPKAGVVFVEGSVEKPGVYPLQADTTVLKAVTMAGGLKFKAKRSAVKVLRTQTGSQPEPVAVDFNYVRQHPDADIRVTDGDIVVVEDDLLRTAVQGAIGGIRGLFSFGYSIR
jgi:polysaccharide export outer membrane protein